MKKLFLINGEYPEVDNAQQAVRQLQRLNEKALNFIEVKQQSELRL
jgi:hypothetical protein